MRVLVFSTTFVWNSFHSKRTRARYHKYISVFMQYTRYSCQILMIIEFSLQILEKLWNIKFHENPSTGNRIVLCGQIDWQTDITKVVVAFHNFAKAPKTDTPPKLGNKNWLKNSETKDESLSHYKMDKISKQVARLYFWKVLVLYHAYINMFSFSLVVKQTYTHSETFKKSLYINIV
jgi:hypothetical protein